MQFADGAVRKIRIMRLRLPLCWFNRHVPNRNRAKWDGLHFISTCRFCGARIRRREHGHWEKDWMDAKPDG